MRQLPHCDHVFHRHCVDPVLEKQIICPVCGTVLTDNPNPAEEVSPRRQLQSPLRRSYSKSAPSSPKSGTSPSWVLVNRPVPLPRNGLENSSSSSDRFEIELNPNSDSLVSSGKSPLLKHLNGSHEVDNWNNVDIDLEQKFIDISFTFGTDIPVEKRQPGTSHSSTNEKGVDSFSFSTGVSANYGTLQEMSSSDAATPPLSNFRSQLRRSRGRESTSFSSDSDPSSTRFSRSTSRSSRCTNSSSDSSVQKFAIWENSHPHLDDVAEHLPLTKPPEQCSFDVLPVITGSGSFDFRDSRESPVGTNRNAYAQL